MEHCPASPSPLLQAPGGTGRKKKKKNWRETERGEGEGKGEGEGSVKEERERDSTRWIMQSCQRRLLLEVLAVLKGSSPDLHQLHLALSPLPMAASRLICAPANGQQQDEVGGRVARGGGEASWWQVDCLGGTHRQRQVRSLLPLFTEVTDREIWADMYSSPRGSIITEQRLSGELPFQQSGQRWRLGVAEGFVCWSQDVCQLSLSKCIR